jgi:hypothetical protein
MSWDVRSGTISGSPYSQAVQGSIEEELPSSIVFMSAAMMSDVSKHFNAGQKRWARTTDEPVRKRQRFMQKHLPGLVAAEHF